MPDTRPGDSTQIVLNLDELLLDSAAVPKSSELNAQGKDAFRDSELVIAFVGAVGADIESVIKIVEQRLKAFAYTSHRIRISSDVISQLPNSEWDASRNDEFARINAFMDFGDEARKNSGDNAILALGVAAKIAELRQPEKEPRRRCAYLIDSLKHPEEVVKLRSIYPQGFYLIGVHADRDRRRDRLADVKMINSGDAEELMDRDEYEFLTHGQRTRDTFHLSDFFVRIDGFDDQLSRSTWRLLDLLFAAPYLTPTFDEYAMFMAYSASLRSADLSRQVGAVITRRREIIATGANDCPAAGGGLYWPEFNENLRGYTDRPNGRDYMRGVDSNKDEQRKIVEEIIQLAGLSGEKAEKFRKDLLDSRISDLTEFGRVVHAEMEALLSCARNHGSTRRATLYCTTFPCHNCAKHIIAAGIARVVYVEPYPKSKAMDFHRDSIKLEFSNDGGLEDEEREPLDAVRFEPFVGVGPRRFFDLFSMRLGSGDPLHRKLADGQIANWTRQSAHLRIQMLPDSYVDLEWYAANAFNDFVSLKGVGDGSSVR